MRDSSQEALDSYHLSQLGVNPPPGLTVTPIGGVSVMNGGPTPITSSLDSLSTLPSVGSLVGVLNKIPSSTTPIKQSTGFPLTSTNSLSGADPVVPAVASTGTSSGAPTATTTTTVTSTLMHSGGGRAKIATVSRIGGGSGRPRIISWMDAPDDVYFYSSESTK